MRPLPPDAALRQLVAELAVIHTHDTAAILEMLTTNERLRVEALMREHTGLFEQALAVSARTFDSAQLSSWLVRRLEEAGSDNPGMTERARKILLESAVRLYPAPGIPS